MRQPLRTGMMLLVFLGLTGVPARADVINTLFCGGTTSVSSGSGFSPIAIHPTGDVAAPGGTQPSDPAEPTAIPEPSMVILGGLGGLLLVGYRRLRGFCS